MLRLNEKAVIHRDINLDDKRSILDCVHNGSFLANAESQTVSLLFLFGKRIELNLLGAIILEEVKRGVSRDEIIHKLAALYKMNREPIAKDVDAFIESCSDMKILV